MEEERIIPSPFIRGLFLGLVISSLVAAAAIALVFHTNLDIGFFEKLIAPLIVFSATLIAALLAVHSVGQNIENQNKLHQDSQNRKRTAALASLPLALREIEDICISVLAQLVDEKKIDYNKSIFITNTAHETIKQVIEYSDKEKQEELGNFLMFYQIAISMFSNYRAALKLYPDADHLRNHNTVNTIIHWISLRSIAGTHLDYARRISHKFSKEKARMEFVNYIRLYRKEGRYKNITDELYEKIFHDASEKEFPGFLDPDFFKVS